jgi:hypothetical protein
MRNLLGEARQRLVRGIDSHSVLPNEPIAADPWIVSSLLQKSIRRGETEIAQPAALTFFKLRGSAIWRRFMVIRIRRYRHWQRVCPDDDRCRWVGCCVAQGLR